MKRGAQIITRSSMGLIISATLLPLCSSAYALTETIQSFSEPEIPALSVNEEPPSPQTRPVSASKAVISQPVQLPIYSVEHPWLTDLPASPTAFVLDRGQLAVRITESAMDFQLDLKAPFLGISYGLFDSVALGVAAEMNGELFGSSALAIFRVKWNFLNVDPWSFAIEPWTGNSSTKKFFPRGLQLSMSRVQDDFHKLHFSASYGQNARSSSYGTPEYHSEYSETTMVGRLSAVYEWRFHREHGLSFSVNPQYIKSSWGGSGSNYSNTNASENYGATLGVGYHFMHKKWAISVGAEAGPSSQSNHYNSVYHYENNYPDTNYYYTTFSVLGMGGISGAIEYGF